MKFTRPEDIILVLPPHRWKEKRYSLGLLYVSSYLKSGGFDNVVAEYKFMGEGYEYKNKVETAQDLIKKLIAVKPKVLGFTCTAPEIWEIVEINNQVKEKIEVISIVGGPHATTAPEDFLRNDFDFVVMGEGEKTSLELVRELEKEEPDFSSVLGLAWKDEHEKITINSSRDLLDVTHLPLPAYDQIKMEKYVSMWDGIVRGVPLRSALVMASRGCPYTCSFCACNKVFGRKVRYRSFESIRDEIKYLRDNFQVEGIWFADDTLTVNSGHVRKICQIMKELGMYWGAQSRVDLTQEELLKLMKDSGCLQLDFGVESGSQRILDEIVNKRTNLAQVEEAFALCKKHSIRTMASLIIGFPTETYQEMKQTFEFGKKLKANFYGVTCCTPLPGTALYERFFKDELALEDYDELCFHRSKDKFNKSEVKNLTELNRYWRARLYEGLKWRNITHPYFFIKIFLKLPHKKERFNFIWFKVRRLFKYLFYSKILKRSFPD